MPGVKALQKLNAAAGCDNLRGIFSAIADYIRECDKILFALCIAATSFGCLAVFSATHYLQNTRQLLVQAVGMLLGIVAVIVISGFDYNNYKKFGQF